VANFRIVSPKPGQRQEEAMKRRALRRMPDPERDAADDADDTSSISHTFETTALDTATMIRVDTEAREPKLP
jgi:hypothetical protein